MVRTMSDRATVINFSIAIVKNRHNTIRLVYENFQINHIAILEFHLALRNLQSLFPLTFIRVGTLAALGSVLGTGGAHYHQQG